MEIWVVVTQFICQVQVLPILPTGFPLRQSGVSAVLAIGGCWQKEQSGLELGCGIGKGGSSFGIPRASKFRAPWVFRQHPSPFTCKTSFIIFPLEDSIFWKLVIPTQNALKNKNQFFNLHYISFIPSFSEQILSSYCISGIELSLGRWEWIVWFLPTRSLHSGCKIYKWGPLNVMQSVLCTRGSGCHEQAQNLWLCSPN